MTGHFVPFKQGMVKRLLVILTARWFVTLLGATALALLIWHLGPLIAFGDARPLESDIARMIAVAAVIVAWSLGTLIAEVRAAHKNRALIEELIKPAVLDPEAIDRMAAKEEIRTLEQDLGEGTDRGQRCP